MDESDNPYKILGVDKDATKQQIRTAYRKLALKHHPDKQKTEADKKKSTVTFAKISNAYELLSDEEQRRKYDQGGIDIDAGGTNGFHYAASHHGDPFAAHADFFRHHRFHDPFSIFEQVFREEFGGGMGRNGGGGNFSNDFHQQRAHASDPFGAFNDPFFSSPFGGMGGMGGSMFDDPFFGGQGHRSQQPQQRQPRGADPFFGGGSLFSSMNNLMNMHNDMMRGAGDPRANGMNGQRSQSISSFSNTSSSFGGGMNGGRSVSTSTTTRIINGKRQTVTEHIITNPDGTVERKVETSGDPDFPSLEDNSRSRQRYLRGDDSEGDLQKTIKKRRSSKRRGQT